MKRKFLFITLAIFLVLSSVISACIFKVHNENNTKVDLSNVLPALNTDTREFVIKAGVNIPGLEGEYFFDYGMYYLKKKSTYTNIKKQGFDHVRLPVDFRLFYDKETDSFNEKLIKKLDKIIDLIENAGLYVIIDFHGWSDIELDKKSDKTLFLNIWESVAERYQNRSNYVIFELMSEPSIKTAPPSELNKLQKEAIEKIRKTNSERFIVCAAPDGNQPWMLENVSLPEDDKNLAVAVHIYNPGDFTHQGYEWAKREKNKQVKLTQAMIDELNRDIDAVKKFVSKTGIPVMINEFGMNLEISDKNDQYTYLGIIAEFCKENGIPWTFWRYNLKEMSLYDNGKWKEDILDVLFVRKEQE